MVTGPATFVVLLIVGLLIVAGALILGSGGRKARGRRSRAAPGDAHVCGQCGHANAPRAGFCARCGHELKRPEA